ncbi:histone methyltransferases(H3-K4 specific) [Raphanus sativus]|nr:histone methyltransferases(H3-K4 specific) [Raphanus sativus]
MHMTMRRLIGGTTRNRRANVCQIMVCHCKPPPDGRLGCGEECLNRMLNIECLHGTCPTGDLCSNQQFQKRKYVKFERFQSGADMQSYEARQKDLLLWVIDAGAKGNLASFH